MFQDTFSVSAILWYKEVHRLQGVNVIVIRGLWPSKEWMQSTVTLLWTLDFTNLSAPPSSSHDNDFFFTIYDLSRSSDEKSEESEEESDVTDDSKMTKAVTGVLMVSHSSYDVSSQHE